MALAGTSLVTTAPAPTMAPSPMVTPGTTVTAAPSHTLRRARNRVRSGVGASDRQDREPCQAKSVAGRGSRLHGFAQPGIINEVGEA